MGGPDLKVKLICIGNELLMDDGVGPAAARYLLSRYRFPDNVEILDRACMGMAIISDLRDCDFALVLDAVDVPGAVPGQVFSFEPTDVAPTPAGMTSLHDVRFADVLGSAEMLGISCRGHCFGIQAENMSPSEFVRALTPKVAAALPLLARNAVRYLGDELGIQTVDLLAVGEAQPVVPTVFGEPDASVMTGYLAHRLEEAGFTPEPVCGRDDAMRIAVRIGCSTEGMSAFADGFTAIEVLPVEDGRPACTIVVSSKATDIDCDAFVKRACAAWK